MRAIVAIDENRGISSNGAMLHHIPEDLAHFRKTTMGHTIIMGHNTFLSLPNGPLDGRRNIVLSRKTPPPRYDGVEIYKSLDDIARDITKDELRTSFIIGGQEVYEATLHLCTEAFVTKIMATSTADRFFPILDSRWTLVHSSEVKTFGNLKFQFQTYKNSKKEELHEVYLKHNV